MRPVPRPAGEETLWNAHFGGDGEAFSVARGNLGKTLCVAYAMANWSRGMTVKRGRSLARLRDNFTAWRAR